MKLFVLRHAKASLGDDRARDFDRPLKERGRADAAAVGQYLNDRDVKFNLVLASPALRVRQTIDRLEAPYGRTLDPDFREPLYNASAMTLLKQLQAVDDQVQNVLLVGHNPGLQELVLLLADSDCIQSAATASFPTGALAELEITGGWGELRPGSCRLVEFIRPRDLAAR